MSQFWRWTKRIAITLAALFGVLLIVVAIMMWWTSRQVAARIEAIREAGDPVAFADLVPVPVDPADSAVTYLQRAYKDACAIDAELNPLRENEEEYYRDSQLDRSFGGLLNEKGATCVREAISAYPEVIPLLVKACKCKTYLSPVDLTGDPSAAIASSIERASVVRGAARVLRLHAQLLAFDGQNDEAIQSGLAIMRLARLGDAEPFLIGHLVANAIRGLGCDAIALTLRAGPVSAASRAEIEQELAWQDSLADYAFCLKSERVFYIHSFRQQIPFPTRLLPNFLLDESSGLDTFARLIKIADQPRYKVSAELAEIEKQASQGGVLTALLSPALFASRGSEDRTQALMRCTRVLTALDAFLEQEPTATPTLQQLDLPADAKIDPLTGDPLKLKQTDNGWIVYSVGADLVDQGGNLGKENTDDVGVGPLRRDGSQ